jgi:hypothetical protein
MRRSASSSLAVATAGWSCLASCLVALAAVPRSARADDTIRRRGDHPHYHVEVEPHLSLGFGGIDGNYGDSVGFGFVPGVRIGIPVVENGFIPSINNSVAVSFGFDAVYYPDCWRGDANCSAWFLEFPATMQWNFYVAQHWSVFGEPGFFIYHGFFSGCAFANGSPCFTPTGYPETGILPAFYAGARYYFSDKVTLTMRVGYPTFSIGVSFLP